MSRFVSNWFMIRCVTHAAAAPHQHNAPAFLATQGPAGQRQQCDTDIAAGSAHEGGVLAKAGVVGVQVLHGQDLTVPRNRAIDVSYYYAHVIEPVRLDVPCYSY